MNSKWENFLKNLGEWRGSFTQISPSGELLSSMPSILSLEGSDQDRLVKLIVRRYQESYDQPPSSYIEQEYRTLGRENIFFDTGAFSKGTIQISPIAEFGAEYGFVSANRRLRFVQLFDLAGSLNRLVLIRECRSGATTPERPPLTVEQLLGTWEGQAVTAYADLSNPDTISTKLSINQIGIDRLEQILSFGNTQISSTARIGIHKLHFEDGNTPREILLLPDGGSSNLPLQIQRHQPLFVEVGWLVADNERQRLIRNYNDKGEWISSTHVIEHRAL